MNPRCRAVLLGLLLGLAAGGEGGSLSVVMVGRNDEWQAGGGLGNFSTRLATSAAAFVLHAERIGMKCQLVVVDYNPPPETLSLREAFFAQAGAVLQRPWQYAEVVFVTVPPAVHAQVIYAMCVCRFSWRRRDLPWGAGPRS